MTYARIIDYGALPVFSEGHCPPPQTICSHLMRLKHLAEFQDLLRENWIKVKGYTRSLPFRTTAVQCAAVCGTLVKQRSQSICWGWPSATTMPEFRSVPVKQTDFLFGTVHCLWWPSWNLTVFRGNTRWQNMNPLTRSVERCSDLPLCSGGVSHVPGDTSRFFSAWLGSRAGTSSRQPLVGWTRRASWPQMEVHKTDSFILPFERKK